MIYEERGKGENEVKNGGGGVTMLGVDFGCVAGTEPRISISYPTKSDPAA